MYFKVKAKQKSRTHPGIKGILLLVLAFVIGYCLIVPNQTGFVGQAFAKVLFKIFGNAALLIPVVTGWLGLSSFQKSRQNKTQIDAVWCLLLLVVGTSFFATSGKILFDLNYGGIVGLKLSSFFERLFGDYLALGVNFLIILWLISLMLRFSLRKIASNIWSTLVKDYNEWQEQRRELLKEKKAIAENQPKILQQPKPAAAAPAGVQQQLFQKPQIIRPKPIEISKKPKPAPEPKPGEGAAMTPPVKYVLPGIDLLSDFSDTVKEFKHEQHLANAELLEKTLADFEIQAKVKDIIPGPVITRFDIELAPGIKIQSVVGLSENLALALKSPSIRVVPIPEKSAVGIEIPNPESCIVGLKEIVSSAEFARSTSLLTLALGKTTDGSAYLTDLMPMPHLLIAGATGSGKSICIHSIILSFLFKARPDEVKLLLIDPKRLELPIYRNLPHIYDPRVPMEKADIVTDPKNAADSLKKLVKVMEKRYEKFAKETVRNIEGYNEKMVEKGLPKEFYIVVIIDELADLMLIATSDVEDSIQRLAQMARAVGIHLILATQRPSVDVITGVIKANFPARMSFQTTSKVDSRVILDYQGAENLLGKGDMLFMPMGESRPIRLQGAYVPIKDAEKVVEFIKNQGVTPQYENLFAAHGSDSEFSSDDKQDPQELMRALRLIQERKRISQDLLKAHFGSSARATNLLSVLETKGFIHKPEGTNRWTIHFDKIEEYMNSSEVNLESKAVNSDS